MASHTTEWLAVLAVLAGAAHVLAPDHWVPGALLSWQRGWRSWKALSFATLLYIAHILLGTALYFALSWAFDIDASTLFTFSVVLVGLVAVARALRFARIDEVFRAGPKSGMWPIFAVMSLLGPCESIIPVLVKSRQLGQGYLLPLAAFLIGTLAAGYALTIAGRALCDRPLWLRRGMGWVTQRVAALPVTLGVLAGLTLLLQLST